MCSKANVSGVCVWARSTMLSKKARGQVPCLTRTVTPKTPKCAVRSLRPNPNSNGSFLRFRVLEIELTPTLTLTLLA